MSTTLDIAITAGQATSDYRTSLLSCGVRLDASGNRALLQWCKERSKIFENHDGPQVHRDCITMVKQNRTTVRAIAAERPSGDLDDAGLGQVINSLNMGTRLCNGGDPEEPGDPGGGARGATRSGV